MWNRKETGIAENAVPVFLLPVFMESTVFYLEEYIDYRYKILDIYKLPI